MDEARERAAELIETEDACFVRNGDAAIAIACAAALAGADRDAVFRLPELEGLERRRIALAKAHAVGRVVQMARLTGAEVVELGSADACSLHHYQGVVARGGIAAILWMHGTSAGLPHAGEVMLAAHAAGVPVIVVTSGGTDWTALADAGADLVLLELGGCGVIAGTHALVSACRLQEQGIGAAMAATGAGIEAAVTALEAWRSDMPPPGMPLGEARPAIILASASDAEEVVRAARAS